MDTSELAALVAMRDSRRLDAFLSELIALHAPGIKSLVDSRQYHVAQVFLSIGRYVQHTLPDGTVRLVRGTEVLGELKPIRTVYALDIESCIRT